MPELPLAGRGVVITRPAEQARQLAELVQANGGTPILFPLLAIVPLEDYSACDTVIATLEHCDWAIFISTNAVQQGMPRLFQQYARPPVKLRFAAIGPSTAAELARFGVAQVLSPQHRFDSESLLALPEMQTVQGRRIMIFRGTGGRELLAEQLTDRGAEVVFAECYRRINPQHDTGTLQRLWQNGQLDAIIVTSSEALRNLLDLTGSAEWLRATSLYVNHRRIADLARTHGLRAAVADGSGDEAMLQSLIRDYPSNK
jgi:uroporphyrinogen-III synthase